MAQREWRGSGSRYTLFWGKAPWTLDVEADRPGLRTEGRPDDCLLALGGVAGVGRYDPEALSGKSLGKVELIAQRVEATYIAEGWGGLQVRASWSPTSGRDGIDLEIQVLASSVDELKGLETLVFSHINSGEDSTTEPPPVWVQPRDPRSAGFSYDGRVPAEELRRLTTLRLLDSTTIDLSQAAVLGPSQGSGDRYLELVHPHDAARKVFRTQTRPETTAGPTHLGHLHVVYALLGHDLEKGVVLRARIRGLWVPDSDIANLPGAACATF